MTADPQTCDVAIIGAGPVGLFAIFEFGMLGMSAHARATAGSPIVVLLESGGVTLGAAGVPRLVRAGPVQPITAFQVIVGVKVAPSFALDIPRDIQRLQATRPGLDDILLEWLHADDAGHLEFAKYATRPVCRDEEPASRRENRMPSPRCAKSASSKSPSTVASSGAVQAWA